MPLSYHEQEDKKIYLKLRSLLKELPKFCGLYFRGIEPRTEARTRLAYAYDLGIFFDFLSSENPLFRYTDLRDMDISVLDRITPRDIEEYLEYLKFRPGGTGDIKNSENALKRKLSSLKSFYRYFYEGEMIETNPAAIVKLPKIHEREIVRLDWHEAAKLLDEAENGENLTSRQKSFHKKTRMRDLAMISLLLGTGMRISECVGIDLSDIDMEETAVRIHRKGGKEEVVYFSDEVARDMVPYMEERKCMAPAPGSENALFLSLQMKRISARSVENMVRKYSSIVTPLKHITPHKLRSTYGTNLYQETGDIYLVADVLGHSDVNTTRKHYAQIDETRRRDARKAVKLRDV